MNSKQLWSNLCLNENHFSIDRKVNSSFFLQLNRGLFSYINHFNQSDSFGQCARESEEEKIEIFIGNNVLQCDKREDESVVFKPIQLGEIWL